MVFNDTCRHCGRPWVFHDDDRPPYFCESCAALYAEILVAQDIIEGRLIIPGGLREQSENEKGEDDADEMD